MARTFRNRPFKIVSDKSDAIYWLESKSEEEVLKMIYQHYNDSHSGGYNTMKRVRHVIEKTRRAKNRQETYRSVHNENYEPNFSPCNSKDSQIEYYS